MVRVDPPVHHGYNRRILDRGRRREARSLLLGLLERLVLRTQASRRQDQGRQDGLE